MFYNKTHRTIIVIDVVASAQPRVWLRENHHRRCSRGGLLVGIRRCTLPAVAGPFQDCGRAVIACSGVVQFRRGHTPAGRFKLFYLGPVSPEGAPATNWLEEDRLLRRYRGAALRDMGHADGRRRRVRNVRTLSGCRALYDTRARDGHGDLGAGRTDPRAQRGGQGGSGPGDSGRHGDHRVAGSSRSTLRWTSGKARRGSTAAVFD